MKIGVVLVTYNRKDKLTKALDSYDNQINKMSFVLVVNNASTDGTKEFLEGWSKEYSEYQKIVVNSPENIGGSGGFALGLEKAIELEPDWIWVSDDDAYPEKDSLAKCEKVINEHEVSDLVAISGAVYVNGKVDTSHRRRIRYGVFKVREEFVPEEEYNSDYFAIDEFSYVGTLIKREVLKDVGITNKDYFIHYDDTEHSLRISRKGKVICVPSIKITHDINANQDSNDKNYNVSWQKYYDYRNLLDMYRRVLPIKYYYFQYYVYKLKSLCPYLFGITKEQNAILKAALFDVKHGVLGVSGQYNPKCIRSGTK